MKKNRIKYSCDYCGKECETQVSRYNMSKGKHYCNKDCYWAYNRGKNHYKYAAANIECDYCAKPIEVNQWLMQNFKHHFCNKKCQDNYCREFGRKGLESHLWKGGKSIVPYTLEFSRQRKREILQRDKNTCQVCGLIWDGKSERMHVHHIDSDKTNSSVFNLICLCKKCHHSVHHNRLFWESTFKYFINQTEVA
jgi:hypothetical protein